MAPLPQLEHFLTQCILRHQAEYRVEFLSKDGEGILTVEEFRMDEGVLQKNRSYRLDMPGGASVRARITAFMEPRGYYCLDVSSDVMMIVCTKLTDPCPKRLRQLSDEAVHALKRCAMTEKLRTAVRQAYTGRVAHMASGRYCDPSANFALSYEAFGLEDSPDAREFLEEYAKQCGLEIKFELGSALFTLKP